MFIYKISLFFLDVEDPVESEEDVCSDYDEEDESLVVSPDGVSDESLATQVQHSVNLDVYKAFVRELYEFEVCSILTFQVTMKWCRLSNKIDLSVSLSVCMLAPAIYVHSKYVYIVIVLKNSPVYLLYS